VFVGQREATAIFVSQVFECKQKPSRAPSGKAFHTIDGNTITLLSQPAQRTLAATATTSV